MIRFFTPVKLTLLLALAAATVAGFVLIPAGTSLPVHWNLAGEPDGYLPREWALLVPVAVTLLVWGIFLFVDRTASERDREAGAYVASVALTAVTSLMVAIVAMTVLIGTGVATNMVQVLAVGVALLLLVLGNAMPKSRPNAYAGIRLPTTLRSEANWAATHRLGGWLTIAAGVVLLAAALATPTQTLFWWVAGCIIVPMGIATGYSLLLAGREGR
ncbi:MAG TPA: SdpI family protein [Devosia sp.]|nr:SdpI family protein [Devosia sp.]